MTMDPRTAMYKVGRIMEWMEGTCHDLDLKEKSGDILDGDEIRQLSGEMFDSMRELQDAMRDMDAGRIF